MGQMGQKNVSIDNTGVICPSFCPNNRGLGHISICGTRELSYKKCENRGTRRFLDCRKNLLCKVWNVPQFVKQGWAGRVLPPRQPLLKKQGLPPLLARRGARYCKKLLKQLWKHDDFRIIFSRVCKVWNVPQSVKRPHQSESPCPLTRVVLTGGLCLFGGSNRPGSQPGSRMRRRGIRRSHRLGNERRDICGTVQCKRSEGRQASRPAIVRDGSRSVLQGAMQEHRKKRLNTMRGRLGN